MVKLYNLINKRREVNKVSDPDVVYHKAMILLEQYGDLELDFSTRLNKKYRIRGRFTNGKYVHFGDMKYEDYTKHNDEERRGKFLKRNAHWMEDYDIYSPAWFSYNLLW
jgi:hypothetical protein